MRKKLIVLKNATRITKFGYAEVVTSIDQANGSTKYYAYYSKIVDLTKLYYSSVSSNNYADNRMMLEDCLKKRYLRN